MKKLYPILLVFVTLLTACSGDDSSNQIQSNNADSVTPVENDSTATDTTNTPAVNIKVSKIKITYTDDPLDDRVINYVYDGEKLISEHTIGADQWDEKLEYVYDGDKIDHVNKYDNGILQRVYNFTYSGNNITQIQTGTTDDNYTYTYTYNQNSQMTGSTIYNNDNSSQSMITYTWDANGNMINVSSDVTIGQTLDASYEYDDKINPLKNYTFCYPEGGFWRFSNNNIKKRISEYNGYVDVWEYQYNDLGYPVKSKTINYQGTEIISEYFYTEN